jgi:hypothetical protein
MTLSNSQNQYFKHTINDKFVTLKTFYIMWMPVQMNKYDELKNNFATANKQINWQTGMLEKAKAFGFGWIGLKDKDGDKEINQEFLAYKIIGDYKQMKDAYSKIMKDYKNIDQMYNLYLTDPKTTKIEENITYILFNLK